MKANTTQTITNTNTNTGRILAASSLVLALLVSACSTDDEPYQLVDVHIGESASVAQDEDAIYTLELTQFADHSEDDLDAYETSRSVLMGLYGARQIVTHEQVHGFDSDLDADQIRLIRWPSASAYERYVANSDYDALSSLGEAVTAKFTVVRVESSNLELSAASLEQDDEAIYVWTAVDAQVETASLSLDSTNDIARLAVTEVFEGSLDIDAIDVAVDTQTDIETLTIECDQLTQVITRVTL